MKKDKTHIASTKQVAKVPNDWQTSKLGDVSVIRGRIGWKGLKKDEYVPNGVYLIAGKHIKKGKVQWERCDYITEDRYNESIEIALQIGDVIFSKDGSLGNPALIRTMPGKATINSTMMLVRPNKQVLNSEYFFQILNSRFFEKLINEKVSGSSIPHIFQADMKGFLLVLPPMKEQQKISLLLNSWDDAIENLSALIQRKERRKKALMQQLLTGKKRFKEFSKEKLKEYTLSKVAKLVRGPFGGSLKKEIFVEDGYKVYEQKNAIYDNFELGNYFITKEKYQELIRFKVEPGDVIMSCSGTAGKFAIAPIGIKPGIINQALLKITVNHQLLINDYFKQFVKSPVFNSQLFKDFAGGAIKNIGSVGSLNKITLKVPSIKEQKKVAAVLSSADVEIQTLKKQLDYCKRQKKGLMQILLTGKKRVKIK